MNRPITDAIICYSGFDRNLPPNLSWGPITRDVYIFECNTSGFGSVIINGREFPVAPGDCYILHPGHTIIHTTASDPRCGVWFAAKGELIGEILKANGITSDNPYAPAKLFDALTSEAIAIVNMQNDTDPGAELRRTGHLFSFLGILLGASHSAGRADWLTQVTGYMEIHYNEPISVSELSSVAHLERSYFSIRFKEKTGLSPHSYLSALRIRKACELMQRMHCSVAEAAELVGLDSRNFSRIFRREKGMTPTQYFKRINE